MPSDNGGMGSIPERVRALEVVSDHIERYVKDRTEAHHNRLLLTDEKLGRVADRVTAVERTAHATETAAAALTEKVQEIHTQAAERRAIDAARSAAKEDRRTARKEAASLILYVLAGLTTIAGVIASLTGSVPSEKLQALDHMKPLLPK